MPYWSSSKVGADPQGQASTRQQQKKKFKGKKGITMEDLKKQTAIRLAQEQQKKSRKNTGGSEESDHVAQATFGVSTTPDLMQYQGRESCMTESGSSYASHSVISHGTQPQLQPILGMESFDPNPCNSDGYCFEPVQPTHSVYNSQRTLNLGGGSFDSAHNAGKGTVKSKLPHGLTVQELKEMTKARLQAEASENTNDTSFRPFLIDQYSQASVVGLGSQELLDHHGSRSFVQNSPLTVGFHGIRSPETVVASVDTREAWETASVSTCTSDFPTSDSVFSNVQDIGSTVPFTRSGSYLHNGGMNEAEWRNHFQEGETNLPSYVIASQNLYYEGGSNRRRTTTLSPRPGALPDLHEERTFTSKQFVHNVESRSVGHPIAQRNPIGFPSSNFHCVPSSLTPHEDSVSVGHSKISDDVSQNLSTFVSSTGTPQRFVNQFEIVREGSLITPNHLLRNQVRDRSSFHGFDRKFDEMVPRSEGSNIPIRKRAETDFLALKNVNVNTSHTFGLSVGVSNDARIRAATWGEPSIDMYGLGLFGTATSDQNVDDRLADDLASILKLSESEQKDSLLFPPDF